MIFKFQRPSVAVIKRRGKDLKDGFLRHWEGGKKVIHKKAFKITCAVIIGVMLVTLLFQKTDPPSVVSQKSNLLSIDGAPLQSNEERLLIDSVKTIQNGKQFGQSRKLNKKQIIKFSGPQVLLRPRLSQIPPGVMAKAVLLTGASNGLVKAQTTESITLNGETILESGTTLVGRGTSTEERLFITFDQMVFKDGTLQGVRAKACDLNDKIEGLKGSRLNSMGWKVASSIGLGFIGGLSEGLEDTDVKEGVAIRKNDLKNATLHGAAVGAIEQSRELMNNAKDKTPILEVPQGTGIYILFEGN